MIRPPSRSTAGRSSTAGPPSRSFLAAAFRALRSLFAGSVLGFAAFEFVRSWLAGLSYSNNTGSAVIVFFLPLPFVVAAIAGVAAAALDLVAWGIPAVLAAGLLAWNAERERVEEVARRREEVAAVQLEAAREGWREQKRAAARPERASRGPYVPPRPGILDVERGLGPEAKPHARRQAIDLLAADPGLAENWRGADGRLSAWHMEQLTVATAEVERATDRPAAERAVRVYDTIVLREDLRGSELGVALGRHADARGIRAVLRGVGDGWFDERLDEAGRLRAEDEASLRRWLTAAAARADASLRWEIDRFADGWLAEHGAAEAGGEGGPEGP